MAERILRMENLIRLLEVHGPLTGKEIHEKTAITIFDLWEECNQCADIILSTIGTRYLRLDKHVEGFARLSPSIIREFYNYTVVSLKEQSEEAHAKADHIHQSIKKISKNKFEVAKDIMEKIIASQQDSQSIQEKTCFIISGDVAYDMAHLEPRPEFSTGKMVKGSDLDIVIIYKDLSEEIIKDIDSTIYEWKFYLLKHPSYKEEIDYVIKDLSVVERQLAFEGFESMIAAKVLEEGKFLCGNHALFAEVKNRVADRGIPEKLAVLKERACIDRENARKRLLAYRDSINDKEMKQLFYTTDEREEFF
ncbi:nucleotidyltransferase domain-containing protein [Desulfitobacterium dehalogenans]|nr:nucleotidyltransferase domain-containing protein [Desulfitobacterium dehalogenans]